MTDVIEQTVEEIPPPKINSVVPMYSGKAADIPDGSLPFYLLYQQGLYLHAKSDFGRAVIPATKMPKKIAEFDHKAGYFELSDIKIPPEICAQAVSFFRRIFEKHSTEAGIYLLMHRDTKEWRIFVPVQKVSHTSVNYAADPTKIPSGYLVMGTIHSHCDFGAFHSGTDTSDAKNGMNGVHITIGHVNRDEPEVATMIMWNKVEFDYSEFGIGDFSQLDIAEAPIEWDDDVIPTGATMTQEQKDTFTEYGEKVTAVIPYQTYTPYQYPQYQYTPKGGENYQYQNYRRPVDTWDDTEIPWWMLPKDDIPDDWKQLYDYHKPEQNEKRVDSDYWEDHLDKEIWDAIFDSRTLTDDDVDEASLAGSDAQSPTFWVAQYLKKLARTVDVLNTLGYDFTYVVKMRKLNAAEDKKDVLLELARILTEDIEETKILDGDFSAVEEDALLPS